MRRSIFPLFYKIRDDCWAMSHPNVYTYKCARTRYGPCARVCVCLIKNINRNRIDQGNHIWFMYCRDVSSHCYTATNSKRLRLMQNNLEFKWYARVHAILINTMTLLATADAAVASLTELFQHESISIYF